MRGIHLLSLSVLSTISPLYPCSLLSYYTHYSRHMQRKRWMENDMDRHASSRRDTRIQTTELPYPSAYFWLSLFHYQRLTPRYAYGGHLSGLFRGHIIAASRFLTSTWQAPKTAEVFDGHVMPLMFIVEPFSLRISRLTKVKLSQRHNSQAVGYQKDNQSIHRRKKAHPSN